MEQPILNSHNKEEYAPAHTAEHLLNQTMVRMFGCERSRNAHIERKKSKINWILRAEPTAEQVAEIERTMNELIREDLAVHFELVDRGQTNCRKTQARCCVWYGLANMMSAPVSETMFRAHER